LVILRDLDVTPTVIAGLDPAIQTSPGIHPDCRWKANKTSTLLDCRIKPGNDGKVGAGRDAVLNALNRTAVGQAR
jgi:hypothetical protein